jgi:alpha-N-arabinofuranosidase
MTNKQGLFLQPTYFPIVEYGKQRNNTAVSAWVSSPTYTVPNRPPLGYLDVSSTFNPRTRELFVNVLNRSKDRAIATRIDNQEGRISTDAAVWELNHPDLKATHTFGDDRKIRPVTRNLSLALDGNSFSYTFPAHSLTILRLKLQ